MAALLGVATICTIRGIEAEFAVPGGSGVSQGALAGCVLALAVGVRAPQRIAQWLGDRLPTRPGPDRQRLDPSTIQRSEPWASARAAFPNETGAAYPSGHYTNGENAPGGDERGSEDRRQSGDDASLDWMVVAVVAFISGLCVAAVPLVTPWVQRLYALSLANFLWTPFPRTILTTTLAFVTAMLPLIPAGLLLNSVFHLSDRRARWRPRAAGWFLLGATLGYAGFGAARGWIGRVEPLLTASALPLLIISIVAVLASRPRASGVHHRAAPVTDTLPALRDRWPTLMRLCIVAVGFGALIYGQAWATAGAQAWKTPPPPIAWVRPVLALGVAGVGILIASRRVARDHATIGGFGLTCGVAGGVVASCTALRRLGAPLGPTMETVVGLVALGLITFAWARGVEALLPRVGSRSAVGGTLLWRTLLALGIGLAVLEPAITPATVVVLLPTVASLGLVSMGALLILREPTSAPRHRLRRLAVATVAAFVLVLAWPPLDGIGGDARRPDAQAVGTATQPPPAERLTQRTR